MLVALSLPLIIFALMHLSLVGMGEESVGYRYFYSLRILYGENETPFLPQGHFLTLMHMALQRFLTWFGFSISDLAMRTEVFSYVSCEIPLVVIFFSFNWAVRPIKEFFIKLIFALALIATAFNLRSGGGFHLLIPDYYIWSLPIGIVGFGLCTRQLLQPTYLRQRWVSLACYAAICFTMKITYMVMPLTLGIYVILNSSIKESIDLAIKTIFTSFALAFVILILYYKGNSFAALHHFNLFDYYQYSESSGLSYSLWLKNILFGHSLDSSTLAAVLPYILTISFMVRVQWKLSLALLIPAILSCMVVIQRPYPPTLVEFSNFGVILFAIWLYSIYSNRKLKFFQFDNKIILGFKLLIAGLMILFTIVSVNTSIQMYLPQYKLSSDAQKKLHNYLGTIHGKTMYIIVNNQYRPTTIDSAIFKGGLDVDTNQWPQSALINSFVPDRSYIVQDKNLSLEISDFNKIVFVYADGFLLDQMQNIDKLYGVDFSYFDCNFTAYLGIGGVNWFVPYIINNIETYSGFFPDDGAIPRILVGCRRKELV